MNQAPSPAPTGLHRAIVPLLARFTLRVLQICANVTWTAISSLNASVSLATQGSIRAAVYAVDQRKP
jgi:hypothetical protein